jgi:D-alanyl-D-alanine carboxypeptidase (penicillin-binding protein 5/6)
MLCTVQKMNTGSTMSEHDALGVMLVASACNYAEAVSTWAFGSQARFLSAAKTWLKAHNLTGTRLVEPTGIDSRNVSTPADLISIGKLALANPAVAAIVKMPSLTIPNHSPSANTNQLLGVDGINGIKTGTLGQAGSCLLFSAVVEIGAAAPITVVGVVLGGEDHSSVDVAVKALLESIRSGFHEVTLVTKGETFGSYATPWKDAAKIVAGRTASVLTWSNTPITSTMSTKTIKTGTVGSTVGSVTFVAGKSTVTVPLVLKGSIQGPDDWWRLTHPGELLKKS